MNAVPRIVVGVDGFESSKAALRWAIHQAKLTGAVVDAVTTWHIPPGSGLVPVAGFLELLATRGWRGITSHLRVPLAQDRR